MLSDRFAGAQAYFLVAALVEAKREDGTLRDLILAGEAPYSAEEVEQILSWIPDITGYLTSFGIHFKRRAERQGGEER